MMLHQTADPTVQKTLIPFHLRVGAVLCVLVNTHIDTHCRLTHTADTHLAEHTCRSDNTEAGDQ